MNKYQEAIKNLETEDGSLEDLKVLQELVDKETPKKVIVSKDSTRVPYKMYYCPKCKRRVKYSPKYCQECGQHLCL